MAIQKANPYPRKNAAMTLDFLEELIAILAKEKGLLPIGETDGGYEDIIFNNAEVKSLSPPIQAVSATIMVESLAEEGGHAILIRFKENGSDPTIESGFGLGHQDIYELIGPTNLSAFKAINRVMGVAMRVQYYQTGQTTDQ